MAEGHIVKYIFLFVLTYTVVNQCGSVYVDKGVPYSVGPLKVGELTVTVTTDDSPKHVKVYFPLEAGEYAVVYFVGGLSSYVPAEAYTIFLSKVAAHGFFVFGVDYVFPVSMEGKHDNNVGEDINQYFKELNFLQTYMRNKTIGVPRWDYTGLLCHSAGCDITLKMIQMNKFPFKATSFLEPYSMLVHKNSTMIYTIPGLMYGTQLAEEGFPACNIKGYDYIQFYDVWRCPRIAMEVAEFGHCDVLDPVFWEGCHVTHFCKTTNNKRLNHYRQTVHGIVTSFFMTTLQGRPDALTYISDVKNIPLKMLNDISDWDC